MVVRLFVGGLPQDISAADLRSRFSPFGLVESLELVPPKDTSVLQDPASSTPAGACRGFAYVELVPKDEGSVQKCLSVYNHSKWRGHELRVELARPTYLARLYVEWLGDKSSDATQLPLSAGTAPREERQASCPGSIPTGVTAGALAAATTAAAAAAAKRAKAAARGATPAPVAPPAPADLSQPLQLPNPRNRHKPISVDLAHPSRPPRRAFPAVPPLPLGRLEWQLDDAGDEEAGVILPAHQQAAARDGRPSKRARSSASGRSALYHLNQLWSLPMRPYMRAANADTEVAAGTAAARAAGVEPSKHVGVNIPPPVQLSASCAASSACDNAGAGPHRLPSSAGGPVMGSVAAKREVRGEVLSMYKVLKSIDSQVRKQAAEEEAGRLAAVRVAEERAGIKRKAQRQGAWALPDRRAPVGAASGLGGGSGDGVVDFMDATAEASAGHADTRLLERFGGSSDDEDERPAAGAVQRHTPVRAVAGRTPPQRQLLASAPQMSPTPPLQPQRRAGPGSAADRKGATAASGQLPESKKRAAADEQGALGGARQLAQTAVLTLSAPPKTAARGGGLTPRTSCKATSEEEESLGRARTGADIEEDTDREEHADHPGGAGVGSKRTAVGVPKQCSGVVSAGAKRPIQQRRSEGNAGQPRPSAAALPSAAPGRMTRSSTGPGVSSANADGDVRLVPSAPRGVAASGGGAASLAAALARFSGDSDSEELFLDVPDYPADRAPGGIARERTQVVKPGLGGRDGINVSHAVEESPEGSALLARGGTSEFGVVSFEAESPLEQPRSSQQGPLLVRKRSWDEVRRMPSQQRAEDKAASTHARSAGPTGGSVRPPAGERGAASAPGSVGAPHRHHATGSALAASFVRPSEDTEALLANWQAQAAGLRAGARTSARAAQRASQGRSARKGVVRR